MERTETLTTAAAPRRDLPGAYVDWAAVLGGGVVAAAIGGLFTTFGAALGLTTISAEPGEGSVWVWLVVTALWIVLSLVASYLAGGYVAGRMRRRLDDASADEVAARDGINGLIVWGLGMLLMAVMAAGVLSHAARTVGAAASGVAQVTGAAVGGAAAAAGGMAAEDDAGLMTYLSDTLLRAPVEGTAPAGDEAAPAAEAPAAADTTTTGTATGTETGAATGTAVDGTATEGTATATPPATTTTGTTDTTSPATTDDPALARQTVGILGNALRTGELPEADRAYLVDAVARQTGLSEAEVEARVDQAVQAVEETRQAAIDAAETARISAILSAFLLAAASLVAAVAAVAGAIRGGRHRDEGRLFGGFSYRI